MLTALPTPYSVHTIGQLAAIWIDTPLVTGDNRMKRITPGTQVCLQSGNLIDCTVADPANHEVVACYGDMFNRNLFFVLRHLTTGRTILHPVQ